MSRWDNPTEGKLTKIACKKLSFEAKKAGLWIHVGKEWYTPEEFETAAERSNIRDYPKVSIFDQSTTKMGDPRKIINRMQDHINQLQSKKKEFENRVNEYFHR